jgi:hypothetical protein
MRACFTHRHARHTPCLPGLSDKMLDTDRLSNTTAHTAKPWQPHASANNHCHALFVGDNRNKQEVVKVQG